MAAFPKKLSIAWGVGALAVLLLLGAGCATTDSFWSAASPGPPKGVVHQVTAWWHNQVLFVPDSVHGGTPMPVLTGRMNLFGPRIDWPLVGDGSVVVDLFEEVPGGPDGKPVWRERFTIDKDTLQRLLTKEMMGWGYTLGLPWGTYRPDITQIRLRLRYDPAQGAPFYTESTVTLTSPDVAKTTAGQREGPLTQTSAKGPAPGKAPPRPITPAPPATPIPLAGPR
jgi:hypothetical protein